MASWETSKVKQLLLLNRGQYVSLGFACNLEVSENDYVRLTDRCVGNS